MTERMENTLRHIKTSVDVDPWAVEEVERVFKGIDDAIVEIKSYKSKYNNQEYGQSYAIKAVNDVVDIIDRHIGERNEGNGQ